MKRILLTLVFGCVLTACQDSESEREIALLESKISALQSQVEKAKSDLDSLRQLDSAFRKMLDSLDMGR